MKMYRGVEVHTHVFLISTLVGGEWSASRPTHFTPGKRAPNLHSIWVWIGPRVGLGDMEKWKFLLPPGLELRPLGRPARSQSLYRLRYPDPSPPPSAEANNEWSSTSTPHFFIAWYLRLRINVTLTQMLYSLGTECAVTQIHAFSVY
jgi:hypothetical protein